MAENQPGTIEDSSVPLPVKGLAYHTKLKGIEYYTLFNSLFGKRFK